MLVLSAKHDVWDFRTLLWKRTSNSYNISSFWICLRLINVWEHENILNVLLKICGYNRNNHKSYDDAFNQLEQRFDFVGWIIKTPCLFYFRSVKVHYVRETHLMLVAFWHWWKLLSHFSTLKTTKQTWTWKCTRCTMQMNYSYVSDLSFKNFCNG